MVSKTDKKKVFRILVLGDATVGKTSLRQRYVKSTFKQSYQMTIGADFGVKRIDFNKEPHIIQIWDVAGGLQFSSVRQMYYEQAHGAMIVFDINNEESFEHVPIWIEELKKNAKIQNLPLILVGNKGDSRKRGQSVTMTRARKYARALSRWSGVKVHYVETSAKSGKNVNDAFDKMIKSIHNTLMSNKNIEYV
jgi:small GTP-binding protein